MVEFLFTLNTTESVILGAKKVEVGKGTFNKRSRKPAGKMTPMQNLITLIAALAMALLFVYGLMSFAGWWDDREIAEIKKSNTKTIGTIVKTGSQKGSYAVAEYYVYGISYRRQGSTPSGNIYVGEHYEVFYAEDDPQQSRIDFSVPLFLKDEVTGFTTGTIFYKNFATVGFKYYVNDQEIRRWQHYKEGLQVEEGETYQVEYLVANPNIGILKLKGL